ncbi:MAG: hypothetical protein ABR912_07060 [Terracidiphilus sp.]|jgi:predicted RNA-binding Zn-ribbon protein involved in translation (DUF1610 family)
MDSNLEPMHGSVKMRANRKVVESRCGICAGEFALGDEVYSCPACGGYHHALCLESGARCPQAAAAAVETMLNPDAPAPPTPWETAPPAEDYSVPAPPPPAPAPPPPPPPAPVPPPAREVPQLSPEALRRKQQIAETYKHWGTEQLERAYQQDRNQYEALALEVMAEELRTRRLTESWMCSQCGVVNPAGTTVCGCGSDGGLEPPPPDSAASQTPLGPDERKCPTCAEIIKREALKCRFCGQVLSPGVFGGASVLGTSLEEEIPQQVIDEIEKAANQGMWFGIASIFCCAPITGPMGISNGNRAIRLLEQYPAYDGRTSARGKARAGQIIGWIALVLFVIGILARIANS